MKKGILMATALAAVLIVSGCNTMLAPSLFMRGEKVEKADASVDVPPAEAVSEVPKIGDYAEPFRLLAKAGNMNYKAYIDSHEGIIDGLRSPLWYRDDQVVKATGSKNPKGELVSWEMGIQGTALWRGCLDQLVPGRTTRADVDKLVQSGWLLRYDSYSYYSALDCWHGEKGAVYQPSLDPLYLPVRKYDLEFAGDTLATVRSTVGTFTLRKYHFGFGEYRIFKAGVPGGIDYADSPGCPQAFAQLSDSDIEWMLSNDQITPMQAADYYVARKRALPGNAVKNQLK